MTLRERTQDILDRRFTQNFILFVILFNSVILGLETVKPVMDRAGALILTLDMICLYIFVAELAAKLFAQRLAFFKRGWNIFDFIIVGISLIPGSGGLSVLRALRILRLLRVLSVAPSLRRVVNLLVGLIVNSMQDAHAEEGNAATSEYRDDVLARLEAIERMLIEKK